MYTICGFENSHGVVSKDSFIDMVHLDDSQTLEEKFKATIKDRQPGRVEFRFLRGDGAIRNVVATITKVTDKSGEAIRLEGTLQDITEQKNHLRAIEEQNSKLREIAWLQSHVVRAPLARIMGLVNCINLDSTQEREMREMIGHILSAANELDGIVREIVNKTEQIENQAGREIKKTYPVVKAVVYDSQEGINEDCRCS